MQLLRGRFPRMHLTHADSTKTSDAWDFKQMAGEDENLCQMHG